MKIELYNDNFQNYKSYGIPTKDRISEYDLDKERRAAEATRKESLLVEPIKICETCTYHDEYTGACCNGDSEYRADFTGDTESCEKWEGKK